jgi:hypothetical protein
MTIASITNCEPGCPRPSAGRCRRARGRTLIRLWVPTMLFLGACSTPDLSPGIAESARLLEATDKGLRPGLAAQAAQEQAKAELAAMQAGRIVLGLEGDCDPAATHNEGRVFSACELLTLAALPAEPVSATQMLAALDALRDYYSGLASLADARSSDEVAAATAGLFDALAQAGKAPGAPKALADFAASGASRKDLATRTTGFLADQYRLAALRRVVRRADPVIDALTERAVAWLELQPGGVGEARKRLSEARLKVLDATGARDLAGQQSATSEMREAFAAFKAAERSSPANQLRLLRQMHAELLARAKSPGNAEDFLTVLEEVRAIADLAAKGG